MTKICYLVRPCAGGMFKHIQNLVAHFSGSCQLVLVVPAGSELISAVNSFPVSVHELPLAENVSVGRDFYSLKSLLAILRGEAPDLLHVHGYKMSFLGLLASRITGVPAVVTLHNFPAYPQERLMSRFYSAMGKLQVDNGLRFITVSHALSRYLQDRMNIPETKIEVIYNGINSKPFEEALLNTEGRRNYSCLDFIKKEGVVLIGSVGRLAPQKGMERLVEAAALLAPRYPRARFVIIGEGPLRPNLERLISKLGLTGRFFLAGYHDNLPAIMSRLDIFVLPSHYEGLSIALLEALAAARPVVATSAGGVPEIVIPKKTGRLVPPGNPGRLAGAIGQMLSNPKEARNLALMGQKLIKTKFSSREMLHKTEAVYEGIVGESDKHEVSKVK